MTEVTATNGSDAKQPSATASRSNSFSQASEGSQTAAEFINSQLQLESDAREALPYQFDTCTRPLGALRQSLFSCLTCNPPPTSSDERYTPAGVCYSCSISCHGEHELVELFCKRNFVCDCGTTRIPSSFPCTLRLNAATGVKGGVHSEEPAQDNKYNQNFKNTFCGCEEKYDPHQEKGTMFQCLGLGTTEDGGCGEDWWHPECVIGLEREAYRKSLEKPVAEGADGATSEPNNGIAVAGEITSEAAPTNASSVPNPAALSTIPEDGVDGNDLAANGEDEPAEDDDTPLPPGFPHEDDFEHFICYKCVEAFPWIKRYAGTPGFLPAVYFKPTTIEHEMQSSHTTTQETTGFINESATTETTSKKRKASSSSEDETPTATSTSMAPPKRQKSEALLTDSTSTTTTLPLTPKKPSTIPTCHLSTLPPASSPRLSLFLLPTFRDHLCRCPSCYPLLIPHPQLLEEEEPYEPPLSTGSPEPDGSVGTGSLLERGEAAFNNMDRVRAIEGAMVYAHLKDKVKAFLQPFAERGEAVGAEDIKAYFEKLRGDAEGIRSAKGGAESSAGKKRDGEGGGGGGGSGGEGGG
ncbi:hypothetical protein K432DRAFT_325117, partial [Lepidopterella palustris CBS 459.81]